MFGWMGIESDAYTSRTSKNSFTDDKVIDVASQAGLKEIGPVAGDARHAIDTLRRDLGSQRKFLDELHLKIVKIEPMLSQLERIREQLNTTWSEVDLNQLKTGFVSSGQFSDTVADLKLEVKTCKVALSTGNNGVPPESVEKMISQAVLAFLQTGRQRECLLKQLEGGLDEKISQATREMFKDAFTEGCMSQKAQLLKPLQESFEERVDMLGQEIFKEFDRRSDVLLKPLEDKLEEKISSLQLGMVEEFDRRVEVSLKPLIDAFNTRMANLEVSLKPLRSDFDTRMQTLQQELSLESNRRHDLCWKPLKTDVDNRLNQLRQDTFKELARMEDLISASVESRRYDKAAVQDMIITLNRQPYSKLGMRLDGGEGESLLIQGIAHDGDIPQWNANNPTQVVKPGDRIVAVNDVRGDCQTMIDQLSSTSRTTMHVVRCQTRPSKVIVKLGEGE